MRIYVVDASVAARFLLVEDLSGKARSVLADFQRGACDLRSPELVVYEVGNTLWKAVRGGLLDPEEAEERFSSFLGLRLDSIGLEDEEYEEALSWGADNAATYYDSVYVIASKKAGATLLTADDALGEKASGEVPTLHLRDY